MVAAAAVAVLLVAARERRRWAKCQEHAHYLGQLAEAYQEIVEGLERDDPGSSDLPRYRRIVANCRRWRRDYLRAAVRPWDPLPDQKPPYHP
jgi:hypothetical protein